jgi:hypothetical protein
MPSRVFHPNAASNWVEALRIAAMIAFWRCSKANVEIARLSPYETTVWAFVNRVHQVLRVRFLVAHDFFEPFRPFRPRC